MTGGKDHVLPAACMAFEIGPHLPEISQGIDEAVFAEFRPYTLAVFEISLAWIGTADGVAASEY
tara:strand:+ start:146 stop:337 length:192 start_codon:yes stop_codon:yes gene_type:complete